MVCGIHLMQWQCSHFCLGWGEPSVVLRCTGRHDPTYLGCLRALGFILLIAPNSRAILKTKIYLSFLQVFQWRTWPGAFFVPSSLPQRLKQTTLPPACSLFLRQGKENRFSLFFPSTHLDVTHVNPIGISMTKAAHTATSACKPIKKCGHPEEGKCSWMSEPDTGRHCWWQQPGCRIFWKADWHGKRKAGKTWTLFCASSWIVGTANLCIHHHSMNSYAHKGMFKCYIHR